MLASVVILVVGGARLGDQWFANGFLTPRVSWAGTDQSSFLDGFGTQSSFQDTSVRRLNEA